MSTKRYPPKKNPNAEFGNTSSKSNAPPATVTEDRRIYFKQQLIQFRDSNEETEISFPANLTSTERKFIHRTCSELGLTSGSSGAGENRFISVHKSTSGVQNANSDRKAIPWSLSPKTVELLNSINFEHVKEVFNTNCKSTLPPPSAVETSPKGKHTISPVKKSAFETLVGTHKAAELKRRQHPDYDTIQVKRSSLPASHHRHEVCSMIKENPIVLISGETGCGKSTQVPQFIVEDEKLGPVCKIVITQPRRISAVSLAERIGFERTEAVGDIVGYNIRLESKQSPRTQILFVTPGVLLRKLIDDPLLEEYSHIIVDEAHERDRFTEFLLIVLRDLSERRKSLRVVLMSATMATHKLRNYFGDIPQLNVGGSVFPVQEFYLEHVLKFINYSPPVLSGISGGGQGNDSRSAKLLTTTTYHCSICHKGPFLSPEELGTHAAQCFPNQNRTEHGGHGQPTSKLNRQGRIQLLNDRLKSLEFKIKMQNPTFTANMVVKLPELGNEKGKEDSEGKNPEGDESNEEGEVQEDGDSDDSDSLVSDEDHNYKIPDGEEIGLDKSAIHSEEDNELNALLKLYQESQSQSDDSQMIDFDLILSLLTYIIKSEFFHPVGHILVFLPGWDDIVRLQKLLSTNNEFANNKKYHILQLHSSIPKREQSMIFQNLANKNEVKIILSTNIAETSLTIDDVSVVIDTGMVKEKVYDPHTKLSYLKTSFISKASSKQRKGRAGRTRSGVCFHLFSLLRARYLQEFQESELLRMPLEELILQGKSLGLAPGKENEPTSIKSFMLKAMDPPHELAVKNGIELLKSIHCFSENEEMTELGQAISHLPFNPRIGKMLLFGCLLGCGPSSCTIASILSYRDPFLLPTNDVQRQRIQQIKMQYLRTSNASSMSSTSTTPMRNKFNQNNVFSPVPGANSANSSFSLNHSDQLIILQLLQSFQSTLHRFHYSEAKMFCEKNDLLYSIMSYLNDINGQISSQLNEITKLPVNHQKLVRNNNNMNLLNIILSSGLYPNVTIRQMSELYFTTEKGFKVKIHPLSINSKLSYYKKENNMKGQALQDGGSTPGAALTASPATPGTPATPLGGRRNVVDIFGYQELFSLNVHQTTYFKNSANYMMLNLTSMNLFVYLLICAKLRVVSEQKSSTLLVEADDWMLFQISEKEYQLIQQSRSLLSNSLILFVKNPQIIFNVDMNRCIDLLIQAMEEEQMEMSKVY
jgi:HrpA-like RNA helicase